MGFFYYNYKHTHSIILMAIAGPEYECLYVDVGSNGRVNDSGIWKKSSGKGKQYCKGNNSNQLSSLMTKNCLTVINPRVFLEDYYFVISSFMMKPFPQQGLTSEKRVGNYRYRRPRRISENLFAFKVTDGEYF